MLYIAHRGFRVGVDENTFHAFNCSIELNMDYIECDVRLSKDKILYVLHDSKLNRTFKAHGHLKKKKFCFLQGINSKNYNYPIPTFEEVIKKYILNAKEKSKTKFMVELKGKKTAEALFNIVNRYPEIITTNLVISSNNLPRLIKIHNLLPEIPLCLNITSCKSFKLHDLYNCNTIQDLPLPFSMISLNSQKIHNNNFISKCKDLKIISLAWKFMNTPEQIEKMKNLIKWGIGGILFDDPEKVQIIRTIPGPL